LKHPEVKSLFKYYPIAKNQISALAQGKVWYSKPAGFNDPFDTRFYVNGNLRKYVQVPNTANINDIFDENMSGAIVTKKVSLEGDLQTFSREIEDLGILSLAESNKNLLMWSHYANDHKGMCLEFERKDDNLLSDDKQVQRIHYSENHPTLSAKALSASATVEASKRRILYTKSSHWKYEEEWRHIVDFGDTLYTWPGPLKSIYFGCKTDEKDIHLIKTIVNDPNVNYSQADLNASKFGMTFKPI
jgi:hypothetical protein